MASDRDSDSESRGEGPSEPKGKGVDPREWGAAGLEPDLNLEAQQQAYELWSRGHQELRVPTPQTVQGQTQTKKPKKKKRTQHETLLQEMSKELQQL